MEAPHVEKSDLADFCRRHHIPWSEIIGMRHKIVQS
jgi:uncharacterized protein with HEPN domain